MFRRRNKRDWLAALREAVWPRSGWRRQGAYHLYRLQRLPGSAYSIAAGFACGAAMSFTPMMGLHFVLSVALAWIIRANLIAALIGTAIGNPWTFPVIWWATYKVGGFILGQGPGLPGDEATFSAMFQGLWRSVIELNATLLVEKVWPIWFPMLIGSIPLGLMTWIACYWPVRKAVSAYHRRRAAKLLKALEEGLSKPRDDASADTGRTERVEKEKAGKETGS